MLNPWCGLPKLPPYVLAEDAPFVAQANARATNRTRIETDLLPEPFLGRLDAPVVLLLLNPGLSADDYVRHARPAFRQRLLGSIQSPSTSTHLYLSDPSCGTAHAWWQRTCRPLIDNLGQDEVERNVLSIEFFPYHSQSFAFGALRLPSQAYSFELVRQAIARRATIVCMRGYSTWCAAVPELAGCELIRATNPRCSVLSPKNLEHYDKVLRALRPNGP